MFGPATRAASASLAPEDMPSTNNPDVTIARANPLTLTVKEARDEVSRLRTLLARADENHDPDLKRKLVEAAETVTRLRAERDAARNELARQEVALTELRELNSLLRQKADPAATRVLSLTPGTERPQLVSAMGEVLPPGYGYNKSYADAPVYDGDRLKYKAWKRALVRKLRASACLYPDPTSGVEYALSRLSGLPEKMVVQADPLTVEKMLEILDAANLDHDEYGTALNAMEKLQMAATESADEFLARWRELNLHLERDENSRPAIREFRGKLPASIANRLVGTTYPTLSALMDRARVIERDLADLNASHPRKAATTTTSAKHAIPAGQPTGSVARSATPPAARKPWTPEQKALAEAGLCFHCKKPGHMSTSCPEKRHPDPKLIAAAQPEETCDSASFSRQSEN